VVSLGVNPSIAEKFVLARLLRYDATIQITINTIFPYGEEVLQKKLESQINEIISNFTWIGYALSTLF